MIPTLTTERLTLRAPGEGDFAAYAAFYADAQASRFYGGPLRADAAWGRLAQDLGHWGLKGHGVWALERRCDGGMIGGCGLYAPTGWPRSELTWWLSPEARGAGYAAEASRAAIAFGYDTLGWNVVETHMLDDNAPARRLVVRLGGEVIARATFPDGRTRDVFALPRFFASVNAGGRPHRRGPVSNKRQKRREKARAASARASVLTPARRAPRSCCPGARAA